MMTTDRAIIKQGIYKPQAFDDRFLIAITSVPYFPRVAQHNRNTTAVSVNGTTHCIERTYNEGMCIFAIN